MTRRNDQLARAEAKQLIRAKSYSYREAAPVLGVCYQHLCLVLNGQRSSRRLLGRIAQMPHKERAA